MILLDKNWFIRLSIQIYEESSTVINCQYHDGEEDKLSLFSPQSSNSHILNAQQSDQLALCLKIPRISTPKKAIAYCTKFSMVQCRSVFPELTP